MLEVMLSQFILKVGWEVLLTPATYAVVGWLKRREGVDVYDVGEGRNRKPPDRHVPHLTLSGTALGGLA